MQLDKLQLELSPRPHAQALDLGFALLRAQAASVYQLWLLLWLPVCALAAALSWWQPSLIWAWLLLPWWLRPWLERAPLYLLSRRVFGEAVSVRQALAAWPRSLGGGPWRLLLTRPIFPGRGLAQPVWMLEGARGAAARKRNRQLGSAGTSRAASIYGLACAHFEAVLSFGLCSLLSLFISGGDNSNPFAIFVMDHGHPNYALLGIVSVLGFTLAGAIVGPIYTASCFALYLNRRAMLEAWDLEIALRQIHKPKPGRGAAVLAALLLLPLLWAGTPVPARAAVLDCPKPKYGNNARIVIAPAPPQSAEQAKLRRDVETSFAGSDLRGYECNTGWFRKNPSRDPDPKMDFRIDYPLLAAITKFLLIGSAVVLGIWLLVRYASRLEWGDASFDEGNAAIEVGGLDIRANSLPADVGASARALWLRGEQRAALGLLYRASLVRLVQDNGLQFVRGATEGDCLRQARAAARAGSLPAARLDAAAQATARWLAGAYGQRWPDDAAFEAGCRHWEQQFQQGAGA